MLGVLLLLITLFLSFTGYLLPWDQLAFWAITVGTSIASYAPLVGKQVKFILLGDSTVGQEVGAYRQSACFPADFVRAEI